MQLNEYQVHCHRYDTYQKTDKVLDLGTMDKVLGLVGESGEVADRVKKIMRDHGGEPTVEDGVKILLELGDTLWYVAEAAHYFGFSLEEVAKANLDKLEKRLQNGTIHGEGDYR